MSNAKRGLRVLGLSLLAAMGAMVFMAAGASAASFDVNSQSGLHATATGALKEEALLLIPGQSNLVIHCATATVTEGLIYADGTKAHATINYSNCKTLVEGKENVKCAPGILPVKVKILPITHSGKSYLLVEPLTAGQPFTTFHYNEDTCALPSLPTVTGSVVFECENGSLVQESCATLKVIRLIKPAPAALFPTDTIKYGLFAATLEGEAEVSLTGAHTGQSFEVLV